MESLPDKIGSAPIVFESRHPQTGEEILIKDFDGFNFWIETKSGEGMSMRKVDVIRLFLNEVHNMFNQMFNEYF